MGRSDLAFRIYGFLVGISMLGTLATRVLAVEPGLVKPVASMAMILCAVWVVATEVGSWRPLAATIAIASATEICSLFTGVPFGIYEYSDRWIPTIEVGSQRFPLLLPGAWILVAWGSFTWVRQFCSGWPAALGTAALAMAIDLPMERAMTDVFGYWTWLPPGPVFGAPASNAVGWFLTALAVVAPFRRLEPAATRFSPRVLGLFCLFVAFCGAQEFWDGAWPLLAGLGLLLWRTRMLPRHPPHAS